MRDVSFIDGRRGWGIRVTYRAPTSPDDDRAGYRAFVMETRDSGRTWRRMARPCEYENYASVSRVSRRKGWIACASEPGAGSQIKEIWRSRDGGRTWHRRGEPPRSGYLDGIFFLRGGHGWLWAPRYVVSKTRDGAKTWRGLRFFEADADFVESMWFVNENRGYATYWYQESKRETRAYELVTTRDGGRTWRVRQRWH